MYPNFQYGDSSVGRPIVTSWQDSTGTKVTLTVYKSSESQSAADWKAAYNAYFEEIWQQHPPAG